MPKLRPSSLTCSFLDQPAVFTPARDMDMAGATPRTKSTYSRGKVAAQPTWKKSHGSLVEACVRRNCRQVNLQRGRVRWSALSHFHEIAPRALPEIA
jgi:hypothetical protein